MQHDTLGSCHDVPADLTCSQATDARTAKLTPQAHYGGGRVRASQPEGRRPQRPRNFPRAERRPAKTPQRGPRRRSGSRREAAAVGWRTAVRLGECMLLPALSRPVGAEKTRSPETCRTIARSASVREFCFGIRVTVAGLNTSRIARWLECALSEGQRRVF